MFNAYIDNSNKSVIHKYPDVIKEIKAPTDDSIRLAEEFRNKAIQNIVAEIKPNDNWFGASGVVYYKDFPSYKTFFNLRFKLNNKEYKVDVELEDKEVWERSYKFKGLGNEVVYNALFEKFSQVIAMELMKENFKTIEDFKV